MPTIQYHTIRDDLPILNPATGVVDFHLVDLADLQTSIMISTVVKVKTVHTTRRVWTRNQESPSQINSACLNQCDAIYKHGTEIDSTGSASI